MQNLIKKHQALQAELAGHEPRINNVCIEGESMIKDNHFASVDIKTKIEELQARWQALMVCTVYNIISSLFQCSLSRS